MTRVAIVGRPNVGKSALFNRLLGRRQAIVDAQSGVTRDRLYAVTEWRGKHFELIDTGGLVSSPDTLESHIARQVAHAVAEADVILFTVDAQTGRTPLDDEVAKRVRATNRPVWLVVAKADNAALDMAWTDFADYGWPRHFSVSSLHGRGINILLDALAEAADEHGASAEPTAMALAIVGRPNAGKSSLLNALVGYERTIVSDIPGTTRDAVDARVAILRERDGAQVEELVTLIDTAGIRRRRTVKSPLDVFAIHRAEKAIARASVAILLLDAAAGVTVTDKKIAALVAEAGKGCVIGVNKWDLIEGATSSDAFRQWAREQLPFVSYAPLVFLSVLRRNNIGLLMQRACAVHDAMLQRVATAALNECLHASFAHTSPPLISGKRLKLYYATQVNVAPPRFALFVNDPRRVRVEYAQFLVGRIRATFGFEGVPIRIDWRPRTHTSAA